MNVFVLCTGRCGSTTFARACSHIQNFTSGHETRVSIAGASRLAYPENHIEIDNRLSWMLGGVDRLYGKNAFYVHLTRNQNEVALSFLDRWPFGIMKAWRQEISPSPEAPNIETAHAMIQTITENITLFLRDKPNQMQIQLEDAKIKFSAFCEAIRARVDMQAAVSEFLIKHNARPQIT